jgi:hypothetical protein
MRSPPPPPERAFPVSWENKSTVEGRLAGSICFEWARSGLCIDLVADLAQLTGQKSG